MNISFWDYVISIIYVISLPCAMLVISGRYAEKPPKYSETGIQWSGYRTGRNTRSKEAWEFSQKYYFSKAEWIALFEVIGSVIIIIKYWHRILFLSFQIEIILLQVVFVIIIPAIPTEIMVHKMFDKNGKRKI